MKAITFLGAAKAYDTAYVLADGREHVAPFFGVALARFIPDLSMRVFVTEKAKEMHLERFLKLVEDNVADVQPVDIPDGSNDAELWKIFQAVVDAVEPEEGVVFDITHGFRSLPFLSFLAAAYLRVVKKIRLEAVLYGNFEARDQSVKPQRAPVIDLTRFVELFDWMVGADRFVRFGDARDLAQLLHARHQSIKPDPRTAGKVALSTWNDSPVRKTASSLTRASQALRVVRPAEAMDASERLCKQLPAALETSAALAQPFALLGDHVLKSFAPIALSAEEQKADPLRALMTERTLIGWYLDRNQIFQAVALAREWLVSWTMAQLGMQDRLLKKNAREPVERALGLELQKRQSKAPPATIPETLPDLGGLPSDEEVVQLYGELGELRNDLMHAGKREHALAADEVEKRAKALYGRLGALPC
ncbi:MAG: TIGR02221 family CRISPR-associated protein [Caldilinea sp.]|nr:TIGR02221 family CRISPR-associated protein [Caldilinea sp.]MDW8442226.1 TIGR02221 family CRISPR-associated protein [Caldilineaceae bacterium]